MKSGKVFFVVSLLFVALMYAVPYGILPGIQGWATFVFWTAATIAYLVVVTIFMRRRF